LTGRVANKVVVVTGAAQGIGRACAEALAAEGAQVVIADVQTAKGEAVAAGIQAAGGQALFHYTDVLYEEQCAALMSAAVQTFGKLDALVNNAGLYPRATLEETTSELWEKVLNLNLRSAFYCCKYAVPYLSAAGGGSIVNIGSIHGIEGAPNLIAYAAAKGGLLTLTRTLAGAYAEQQIRANYIIPGWVLTEGELEMMKSLGIGEEELKRRGAAQRLGRHQTPMDTAYAVLYLVSDEASQITGSVFHLDAGHSTLPHPPANFTG
jgi:NAD(P)-dependent dehydrogenase (short-subunit alcohol dehydrogenase family)